MSGAVNLNELFAGYADAPSLTVRGLALDSRRVRPGDVFLAVRGSAAHGLTHLAQAQARGAAAVAWEPAPGVEAPNTSLPAFAVERLSERVGDIAARFYGQPSQRQYVVGITGTDGKTSTAHLIAQAFEHLGRDCAYAGTLGLGRLSALDEATHTTPDPVSLQAWLAHMLSEGSATVAMEVSSHALDQNRVGGIAFDAAVLTNITRDHLDYHGTVERYAAAKRRLFEPEDARALILNRDDSFGLQWLAEFSHLTSHASRLTAFGLEGAAPSNTRYVIGRDLQLTGEGLNLTLDTSWGQAFVPTRLLGRFNAYNLLATAAVLLHAGVSIDEVAQALSRLRTVPGRIEGFRGGRQSPLVVVDYAHTPKALEQILKAVRAHTAGRLWCVFGCGGDRDRGKRPLMAAAAAAQADALIVTDDNPRSESPASIVAEILKGLPAATPHRVIHDRAAAIRAAISEAGFNDSVVIAGKGHEDYQIYGSERRDFSDRAFVSELLEASA